MQSETLSCIIYIKPHNLLSLNMEQLFSRSSTHTDTQNIQLVLNYGDSIIVMLQGNWFGAAGTYNTRGPFKTC